jgi:hypothetical protein
VKTKLLKFPENTNNPLDCADWMELVALVSPEGRCSIAAVERNLKRLSAYDASTTMQQNSKVEAACGEILGEMKRRALAAGGAYPFAVESAGIVTNGDASKFAPYIFCLCLSWFGWQQRRGNRTFPRRMFEDLSKYAAQAFVGGKALRFGAPRTEPLPRPFRDALTHLAIAIGEGQAREIEGSVNAQDDTLDLVAWRDFPDGAEGKLILVGQCASGANWEGKKRELDHLAFFNDWFSDQPPSLNHGMRVGFFVPCRVPKKKWIPTTRRAGIIFDRCRIAYWSQNNPEFKNREGYCDWSRRALAGLRQRGT